MIGFVFGWGEEEDIIGRFDPEEFDLEEDLDGPCDLILNYGYINVLFIFGFVYSKTYLLVDPYDVAVELDSDDVEEVLGENPIGFLDRFGLLILIVGVVLFSAVGGVLGR